MYYCGYIIVYEIYKIKCWNKWINSIVVHIQVKYFSRTEIKKLKTVDPDSEKLKTINAVTLLLVDSCGYW